MGWVRRRGGTHSAAPYDAGRASPAHLTPKLLAFSFPQYFPCMWEQVLTCTCTHTCTLCVHARVHYTTRIPELTVEAKRPASHTSHASSHPQQRTHLASRRAISVLPQPVGPIISMLRGTTSRAASASSWWRRHRLRSATATARLASWRCRRRKSGQIGAQVCAFSGAACCAGVVWGQPWNARQRCQLAAGRTLQRSRPPAPKKLYTEGRR